MQRLEALDAARLTAHRSTSTPASAFSALPLPPPLSLNASTYVGATTSISHSAVYQPLLHASIFSLVPCGNNPETFRLWEALQTGSIPIVERCEGRGWGGGKHYLSVVLRAAPHFVARADSCEARLPPPPFPIVTDFEEALVTALTPYLLHSAEAGFDWSALERLQADTAQWWTAFKRCVLHNIARKLQEKWVY